MFEFQSYRWYSHQLECGCYCRVRNLAAETIEMADVLLIPSLKARRFRVGCIGRMIVGLVLASVRVDME